MMMYKNKIPPIALNETFHLLIFKLIFSVYDIRLYGRSLADVLIAMLRNSSSSATWFFKGCALTESVEFLTTNTISRQATIKMLPCSSFLCKFEFRVCWEKTFWPTPGCSLIAYVIRQVINNVSK